VWKLIVWFLQRGERPKWALNNFFWLCVAWATWADLHNANQDGQIAYQLAMFSGVFAVIEIARSAIDYCFNWPFYFPSRHRRLG
jgi:hypothetical protein